MTVRIGETRCTGRRRGRGEAPIRDGGIRRRIALAPQFRRRRSAWWYHLEFALLKSRA
jgi:hypothetical protein